MRQMSFLYVSKSLVAALILAMSLKFSDYTLCWSVQYIDTYEHTYTNLLYIAIRTVVRTYHTVVTVQSYSRAIAIIDLVNVYS